MREVKFRAWDNNLKDFVNPDFIHPLGNGNWSWWDDVNEIEACNGDGCGSQAYLMQFTGLLDKNGKEIWEGDIVKRWTAGTCPIYPVEWGEIGWNPFENDLCNLGSVAYYEVIGNIHENPELEAGK